MSSSGYVNAGISALANATQVAAYQIPLVASFNQFTTVTAVLNSCLLPSNPSSGQICKIRNDSATGFSLNVFPQVAGQINSLGLNTAFVVAPGMQAEFVANGSITWLTDSVAWPGVPISAAMTASATATRVSAQAAGAVIPVNQVQTLVGTCATYGNSIGLPQVPLIDVPYTIINQGAQACAIYAGLVATASLIDAIPSDNTNTCFFPLAAGARCTFTAVSNVAGLVQWFSSGLIGPRLVVPVAAARTILAQESGALIAVNDNGAYAITLPAVALGLSYLFVATAIAGAGIVSIGNVAGGLMNGTITCLSTGTVGVNRSTINFTANTVVGDTIEVFCPGAIWNYRGLSQITTGSITVTA